MPGPPKKPTILKVLQGTKRKDSAHPNEPMLKSVELVPPDWLSATAKEAFEELARLLGPAQMRVATKADRMALELLCDAYAEFRALRAILKKKGRTYTMRTKSGDRMPVQRPEVSMASDAFARTTKMLCQFGLTPAAKTKVGSTPIEERDPFEEFLKDARS